VQTTGTFVTDSYLSANINGTTTNDRFLRMYSGTGGFHDTNRVFWGDNAVAGGKTARGFISIVVSGTTYYTRVYTGGSTVQCSTNYVGTYLTTGTFRSEGYVPVLINNSIVRYIRVYSYTP
jgi:hypothetical protein